MKNQDYHFLFFRRCVQTIFLVFFFISTAFAATGLQITVQRVYESQQCSIGELFVDNKFVAYTLELPYNNNLAFSSSIPAGTYPAIVRYDQTKLWKDDNPLNRWRIELANVPGSEGQPPREHIEIHMGKYPRNTQGCLILGQIAVSRTCVLSYSKEAYSSFKSSFYGNPNPTATPNKAISVDIHHFVSSDQSTEYAYDGGSFKQSGIQWTEMRGNTRFRTFREEYRNLDHIKLVNSDGIIVWLPLGHGPIPETAYIRERNSAEKRPYMTVVRHN